MKKVNWIWCSSAFLIVIGLGTSCKTKINTRADLIQYINDPENGLVKTLEINGIKAELRYKPGALMKINSGNWPKLTGNNMDRAIKNKVFFVFGLSAGNKEVLKQLPFTKYSELVQVMSFQMTNYINLTPDENDPVSPEGCLFQQTYGMAHANQLLLVFDQAKLKNVKHLYIKIKEFGLGTGDLNFQMNTQDINDLPPAVMN
ncbi:MAG: hypothetical protein AAGC65_01725 [Mucilaginibacter sp.]|uniref:hypothetical protein n=1 Tax=Mucilaginibacter sp. TaxID=1882438 RepID=UPI0031A9FFD6